MPRFWIAAACAAILPAGLTAAIAVSASQATGATFREAGQAFTALAAFVSCGWLARQSVGRLRWAWGLLAMSALVVLAGEIGKAALAGSTGLVPAFVPISDPGLRVALPVAIAGLLLFPPERNQYASGRRAALDVGMIALSLVFIGSSLSLPQLFERFSSPNLSFLGFGTPVLDVVLVTVIFYVLRRSQRQLRSRLAFVLAGFAVIAISDSASVLLAANGHLTLRDLVGSGSMYGYALVALGPLWPEPRLAAAEDEVPPLWPDLLPYIGVVAVAITAIWISIERQPMTAYAAAAAGGLAMILLASHLLSQSEARGLLRKSKRDQARLAEREEMLNDVVDHAPQGVASITLERRITNANPRLASMLYAPLQVLVGSVTDAFLPEDYVSRVFRSFSATPDGPETYESDCQASRADGSKFWVHWSATPIRDDAGGIDYVMATFEDVTAKREAEELSAANLAQMEKLNRLKSEFVSMVSHEFRTALVGIQGFSELIRDQEMDPSEMKVLADEIYNDSQRLNRMITEMLDFDRLEAGKLHLDLRPLDINALIAEAVEHATVSTKKHFLQVELQPGLPPVLGDSDRLIQVLTNLLSNAIKYSPNGGDIRVSSTLAGGTVEISVLDHGKGIPPEFISRLFGRYERYEDKHAGKIIGTGLGLAITRQIVEMHGGRIAVDSVVGKGSEFRFTVPLASTVAAITRSA